MTATSPAPVQYPVTTGRYVPGYISSDEGIFNDSLVVNGPATIGGPLNATRGITGPVNGVSFSGIPGIAQVPVTTSSTAAVYQSGMGFGPWVADVRFYGAKGDGQAVADGAMTSGQPTLTCATTKPFKPSDVGKQVLVAHAGPTGVTTLVTTISGYTDASHVTLAANASGNVSSSCVMWGTDDTAAIQAAVNAATAYGQVTGTGVVWFPPIGAFYCVAGPLVTTVSGNSQITIPIVGTPTMSNTQNKVVLVFAGAGNGAVTRHWQQTVPTTGGSTIVSFGAFASTAAQITSLNAGGQAACIGGPTGANSYGTNVLTPDSTGSIFNNVMPVFSGISVLTTHTVNGIGYSALNLHGCGTAGLFDFGFGTTGTVPGSDYSTPVTFANGVVVGVVLPASGNNDSIPMRNVTCHGGYTRAIYLTEHADWQDGTVLYCWSGICPVGSYGDGGTGTGAFHAVNWSQVSVEGCTYNGEVIGAGASGIGPQIHGVIDNEGVPKWHDNNSGTGLAAAVGVVRVSGGGNAITTDNGTSLQLINEIQAPGPVAQIALTINTAAQNTYWRWATVYLAGGTVTTVQVSSLMGGASAPALTTVYTQSSAALPLMMLRVPPGGWLKVNGTVIPTTNSWILD